ncbi:major tail protein [Streptomyces phage Mojorita]|uniref:Major tail protein n=1 Tax=Streptomyces phage Mojorita TaxID=1920309 RepID=A0A1J0MCA3_9CAUD|nr:major tail protein [Streptomyces phage Mojorita]
MGRPLDARGWEFEVEDTTPTTPVWLRLNNLNQWSYSPSENEETADTTTNDSAGYYEQDIMQRGATLEVTGQYAQTGGVRDAAQEYIDTVWTYRFGAESRGRMRYRHKTQTKWSVWECTVTPGEQGGEHNAKVTWGATFTRCGAPTSENVSGGTP